ncbi:unnamed protein product [Sympodiomycopsis kandeliae]
MAPSSYQPPIQTVETTTSKDAALRIRQATEGDILTIVNLIKELAIYEKEPDEAKATPESIRQIVFEKGYAEVILAELKDDQEGGLWKAVGISVFCFKFSTWTSRPSLYLEDLFVLEPYRNHKIGTTLFRVLGTIAKDRGCARLDFEVLDWNKPSIAFYENVLKAKARPGWTQMRLEGDSLDQLTDLGLKQ